ncbi:MAG: DNA-primase RepB domain-containing protein [Armatimonadetes bacterium]|nr:DNA-primase RepB domain-containing protein [Armatimonadota bacterium]
MSHQSRNHTTLAALDMLDAFASVGAATFDLTLTSCEGEKVSFRRAVPLQELASLVPDVLARADAQRWNVIVRPKPPPVFLQLDDLHDDARARVEPVSFLSLQTSPGNYQAWIALSEIREPDSGRRVRASVGADPSASGATRVAGSNNFKAKYAPTFPIVAICHVTAGLLVDEAALIEAGLVRAQAAERERVSGDTPRHVRTRRWPSYERCLAGAPMNHEGSAIDSSRADFTFCLIALDWGWSMAETVDRLMDESAKAKENGPRYANLTAQHAADALARRRAQLR